jgi:hypothetical protein
MKLNFIITAIAVVTLTSCNNSKTNATVETTTNGNPTSTTYKGALPGGEFKGINATLELTADSNCMMTYIYEGIDTKLIDKGRYTISGDMLQTTFTEVPKLYKITGDSLQQLDDMGNAIEDGKQHSLAKQL